QERRGISEKSSLRNQLLSERVGWIGVGWVRMRRQDGAVSLRFEAQLVPPAAVRQDQQAPMLLRLEDVRHAQRGCARLGKESLAVAPWVVGRGRLMQEANDFRLN